MGLNGYVFCELNRRVGVLPPGALPGQADITGPDGHERLRLGEVQ